MKYLCLIFFDERNLDALTTDQAKALVEESLNYDDVLRRGGHFIAAQALEPVRAAATIRRQDDKALVTDGPFAETHEQIGGFILLDAPSMQEAVDLAKKIPPARLGGVEVRPIKDLTDTRTAG